IGPECAPCPGGSESLGRRQQWPHSGRAASALHGGDLSPRLRLGDAVPGSRWLSEGSRREDSSRGARCAVFRGAADALLADLPPAQLAKLDALLIPDPAFAATPLAWLRNAPTAPKPDHVRALLDRLRRVREIGVPPEAAGRIHDNRFQQLLREGRISDSHQIGRYAVQRRRAIVVAAIIDLESRLTDAVLPGVRITEVLHEVSRETGFSTAFTNLRTGEACDNENALLAAILADATKLGLSRMAAASQGVTRDRLIWIADAYIRPETYKAALAQIINAHHALPIAAIWGDGTTSSSDGQFFRSAKRGDAAGDVNARYGHDPGFSFYTHLSDQHGPYSIKVMSATNHEAPYVLDGLLHHGTQLNIGTHYTDTGGASDHVFILCALLGFRFCPRLRDLPERKLACITPAATYPYLQPLLGQRIKTDVIREHWVGIIILVASLKAGIMSPS